MPFGAFLSQILLALNESPSEKEGKCAVLLERERRYRLPQ